MGFQQKGSENITIINNTVQYNNGFGVEAYAAKNNKVENNKDAGNGMNTIRQKIK